MLTGKKEDEPLEEERSQEQMLEAMLHKALESNRVVIDFDVIALAGLTAAIYQLNPIKVQEAFNAQLMAGFGVIAEGFGNVIEGAGDALGGFWDWLIGGS